MVGIGLSVDIQLDEPEALYLPGDKVTGQLVVTGKTHEPVTVSELKVEFIGTLETALFEASDYGPSPDYDGIHESTSSSSSMASTICTKSGAPPPPKEASRNSPPASPASSASRLELEVEAKSGASEASAPRRHHPRHRLNFGSHMPSEKRSKISTLVKAAKTQIHERATFNQGITTVPFDITIPRRMEDQPLWPSIREGDFRMHYELRGVATVGLLWDYVWLPASSTRAITVVAPASQLDIQRADSTITAETEGIVGTWTAGSLHWKQLVKWAFGGNTAESWTRFRAAFTLPGGVSVVSAPYYLQDAAKIELTSYPGDTNADGNDLPSDSESEKKPTCDEKDIIVDYVYLKMTTTIQALRNRKIAHQQTTRKLLEAHHLRYPVHLSRKPANITAIISGARIPEGTTPSIDQAELTIKHSIICDLGVASSSPDGTRQDVHHFSLTIPLTLVGQSNNAALGTAFTPLPTVTSSAKDEEPELISL